VTPGRSRAIRHGLFLAGLAVLAWMLYGAWLSASDLSAGEAYDARAYWEAARGDVYGRPVLGSEAAYYYSPAFLQAFGPLLALPFLAFLAAWYALTAAALAWVVRWWLPFVLLTGFVGIELIRGNIEPLMAVAIVVGMRYPAAWAFILLTKVTPGVGLVWFVARREWRSLAIALGATAVITGISFVVAPGLWFDWIRSLAENTGVNIDWAYFPVPLVIRLPIAAALVWFAARRDAAWLVPIGATLAMPALWPVNLTLLVAAIPLSTWRPPRGLAAQLEPHPDVAAANVQVQVN
jgi:hypothetical protein